MAKLEKVLVSKKTFGEYIGTLEWYVKDNVWTDNCFKSTITDRAGNIIEVIDKIRPVPEKVKPDHIVPPPIEGEPPIEGTGKLWYFDPPYLSEDYIFTPLLKAPVTAWVIKVNTDVLIFNAETGKQIGRARPPPGEKSVTLAYYFGQYEQGVWDYAKNNANKWFKELGFNNTDLSAILSTNPRKVREYLQDNNNKYWYSMAHGHWDGIDCVVSAHELTRWMDDRAPMWFAFINSCYAMQKTGNGSLSYAFRKGSMKGTVTVGLRISKCPSKTWESKFFKNVRDGATWGDAFDRANAAYPQYDYYGFCGDRNMKLIGSEEIIKLKGIDRFLFTGGVIENHLPEYAKGYVCNASSYIPPEGYKVTSSQQDYYGPHTCGSMSFVKWFRCDKIGYVPSKTQIKATTTPAGASIWLRKH